MTGRGFTLLEVMIAVAILGLSLTAIFSSEVGAANVAARARRQNVAATLARCKMGEIEEVIAIEGLPALEKKDTDSCCEHAPPTAVVSTPRSRASSANGSSSESSSRSSAPKTTKTRTRTLVTPRIASSRKPPRKSTAKVARRKR
jgi:prepilin-type N-terminal cleavage/methylation domain-containing protein